MPPAYTVILKTSAEKEFASLPRSLRRRIQTRLLSLEHQPRPPGCVKLKGAGYYRIRVGRYRVLYDVDDKARRATVLSIGHRREAYR